MKMLAHPGLNSRYPGWRTALVETTSGREISYKQLAELISAFGVLLGQKHIQPGKRISIVSRSSFDACLAILACLGNSVVANPLNPNLPESLISEFIAHAESSLVLADDVNLLPASVRGQYPILSIENCFNCTASGAGITDAKQTALGGLLIYTSGTTGTAKGVLLSTANIEANVITAAASFRYEAQWRSACLLPLYHTFGLISDVLPILLAGGTAVILPAFEMSQARLTVETFRKYKVNSFSAPPIIFDAFVALDCLADTHLRFAIAGAAPLYETTKADYETRFGHSIIPCYGLTEATCFATISPMDAIRPNSAGKPANIQICVQDEHASLLPPGAIGEIALRGDSVIRGGYYRDGGRYTSAFTVDGWFLTGDLGYLDRDGYLYVTGRKKNMVIRGGEKIYLEDVDRSLIQHPGIADAASIMIVVKESWDLAIAFVVSRSTGEVSTDLLVSHIRNYLGPNHVPDEIIFIDKIPRTPTGKPILMELTSLYQCRKTT